MKGRSVVLMALIVLLISGTSILYFGRVIRQIQEQYYMTTSVSLSKTAALALDKSDVAALRRAVSEIYDRSPFYVSNEEQDSERFHTSRSLPVSRAPSPPCACATGFGRFRT